MRRPSPLLTAGFAAGLALLACASVLAQALLHFDPGSAPVTAWNSDAAIPVLQGNDPVFDVFRLYYYGQDRIGAWPWLLAQALRALTGFAWTPYRMFAWQATCALLALPVLLRLHRAAGPLLAVTYAALALLSPLFQVQLFALSQPFGWQLIALLLSWWALARGVERLGEERGAGPGAGRWLALATLGCVLACWTSPTSGPLLLVGAALAALPAWLTRPALRRRLLLAVAPIGAGIVFEALVRHVYHRFARAHFGRVTTTKIQLDVGHLADNARGVLGRLLEHPLLPLLLLGLALGLLALGLLARAWRRGMLGALDVPLATLTAGLAAAALANAAINVLVRHVRLNGYDIRYLVPTFALGALAAAAGLVLLLQRWGPVRAHARAACAGLALLLLLATHAAVAPRVPEPLLARAQGAVDAVLARRPGGAVLLGGYWDSYLLAALDPALRLAPLVPAGEWLRTPFHVPRLQAAQELLVAFTQGRAEQPVGSAQQPHPWLLQYGRVFALAEPRWVEQPPFTLARYVSAQARTAPVALEPARFEPWREGAALTVRLEPPQPAGLLLLSTGTPPDGIELEAPGAAEARLEGLPGLWLVHLRTAPGAPPLRAVTFRVRRAVDTEQKFFEGAALVTEGLDARPPDAQAPRP